MVRRLLFMFIASSLLLPGCVKKKTAGSGSSEGKGGASVPVVTSVVTRPDKAPNFSWKDSTGHTVDFDAFRGTVTLVNFWATWCGPCKRELPDLIALSKEFSGRNVRVLGISTDRGPNVAEEVTSFVREKNIPYQVLLSSEDLEEAFGNIMNIPTTFVIDADGKISQKIVGSQTKDFFASAITPLLK